MKTILFLLCGCVAASSFINLQAAEPPRITGGSVTGGSATGGSATGGSATGGSATGGSVNSTTVTSGTSTPGTVAPGTATATADGREITVTAPGAVSVNVSNGEALVSVAQQKLIVGKTKLKWDGKDLGDIPASIKKIKIVEDEGMLSIKGDGKEYARVKIGDPQK